MEQLGETVIYQIYPKSFKDTDGNGLGDIRGIIEKLDYLEKLGVDMVWMNPIFVSPQNDNGYDIADYYAIDPVFGTMEELEELIQKGKERGISFMFDMVLNHTSTAHEWFQRALAGEKKYQDYYILREPKEDGSLPTNWESKFGGPAWSPFGDTGKYYLHLYDVTQADLNWRNEEVRKELYKVVQFWMDKGMKGFRFDVLNVIGKEGILVDSSGNNEKSLYTDTPIVHEWVHEMEEQTFGKDPSIVTVGEMSSTTVENGILYSAPIRHELSMIFSFHHLKVDYENGEKWSDVPFDFQELKQTIDEWQVGMQRGNGWNALFLNNHDQPRANSRFGDPKNYPYETATMLAQTIHLLRGTPYIYQGEEIGMTNPDFEDIDSYMDVETHNAYERLLLGGKTKEEAIHIIQKKSRDTSRTPMQWTDEPNGGFTTGTPWLAVAENAKSINVESELKDGKIFPYYQRLIQLRKEFPVIATGTYEGVALADAEVYAYVRSNETHELLVLNHFYGTTYSFDVPTFFDRTKAKWFIGNYEERELEATMSLRPYETVAFLIEK